MPDHLEQASRELKAHFGAAITPAQIEAIIQAILSIVSIFKPIPAPPSQSAARTNPKP